VNWRMSHRADPLALPLADRHYNRQKPGSPQFMPPGSCVCFVAGDPVRAIWGTSWPFAEYVKHDWAGAWMNSVFRSEGAGVASVLIREAIAATREVYGEPPVLGMVTFVDPSKVPGTKRRGRIIYGYSYLAAGFRHVGFTKAGLWAWQMLPADMPEASAPIGHQMLIGGAA
jgi:hypothetical protein